MIGGSSTNWQVSADWLQGLEIDQVINWFGAQRSSTRLGDHFAFCVEYVLRFSPVVQAKHLLISQQVLLRLVQNSSSMELGTIDGISNLDSTSPTSAGTSRNASDVIVKAQNKEAFVKPCNNIFYCFTEEKSTDMMSTPINFNSVQNSDSLIEGLGVLCREETLKDIQADTDGSKNEQLFLAGGNNDALFARRLGKRKKKLLKKSQRLRNGRGATITVGEFDFLFQCETDNVQKKHSEVDYSTCFNLTSAEHENSGNVRKSRCSAGQTSQELPMINRLGGESMEVHHWEVSVKFLLYAGPWEVFKLATPSFAAWKGAKLDEDAYKESWSLNGVGTETRQYNADYNTSGEFPTQIGSRLVPKDVCETDAFLGCFLGPHIGETLYNRKTRLINQLALSRNVHAAALVHRLYTFHLLDEKDKMSHGSDLPKNNSVAFSPEEYTADDECLPVRDHCNVSRTQESLDWSKGEESKQVENAEVKSVRISPRALIKGYLFYEYELWFLLSLQRNADRTSGGLTSDSYQTKGCSLSEGLFGENLDGETHHLRKEQEQEVVDMPLKCMVNRGHWMGWWTHIGDFYMFASSPCHRSSMWYIVPKNEWLSPVVIDENDEERCARVLSMEDFLIVSAKVAEEANRTNIPRKRRFMVAEVRRNTYPNKFELQSRKHQKHNGKQINDGNGSWTEVSRGFVVEESWPDSRLYRPHGYVLSWSSSLIHGI